MNHEFDTSADALAHYGVKGMRWGVRKDDRTSSRSARRKEARVAEAANLRARAAKTDVRIREVEAELASVKKAGANINSQYRLQSELHGDRAYRDRLNEEASRLESGRLSKQQKTLLIGGGLAAVAVIGVYGHSKLSSGESRLLAMRGEEQATGVKPEMARNEAWAGKMSADDVLSNVVPGINPGYREPGGQMNCRRCSFTYELRRRGYDVEATTSAVGHGQSESGLLNALTPGEKKVLGRASLSEGVARGKGIRAKLPWDKREAVGDRYSHADAKDRKGFFDLLNQQPDGARGEAVFNFGRFGHSLSYEKFGDKIYIFDTQKGQRYDVGNEKEYNSFLEKWGVDRVADIQVTRLDNAPLDIEFLKKWSANRSVPIPRTRTVGPQTKTRPENMSKDLWEELQATRREIKV